MTRLISNDRRLRNLELSRRFHPPSHLPLNLWTDEQLCLFVSGGRKRTLSNEELQRCIEEAPDHVLERLAEDTPDTPMDGL